MYPRVVGRMIEMHNLVHQGSVQVEDGSETHEEKPVLGR